MFTWETVTERVEAVCEPAGLDIVHPFTVGVYNRAVERALRLPDFGDPRSLGLLIGHSRALWSPFCDTLRDFPELLDEEHPIETYVEACVGEAADQMPARWEVRWDFEAPPRRIALQRLAHATGLAHYSPSFLSVHSAYGPWIGLRAALVVDIPGPPTRRDGAHDPCSACPKPCLGPFEIAKALGGAGGFEPETVRAHWREWLAVRDACPQGSGARYDEAQIEYHYTHDRDALRVRIAN